MSARSPRRDLPCELYRTDEVRALELCAIGEFGIAGLTLMERAGRAAFAIIQRRWPRAERIIVCCGAGNNGGDGYVVARLAKLAGKNVSVLHVGSRDALSGDARMAMEQAVAAQVPMQQPSIQREPIKQRLPKQAPTSGMDAVFFGEPVDLLVDGLLGIGLKGALRGDYPAVIAALNSSGAPVLALDIPSGLCADTGMVAESDTAVRADATVTFIGLKRGLFTGRGPALCGDIYVDDLALPRDIYARVPSTCIRIDETLLQKQLSARARDAHKGHFGHVLVIGGDYGFAGAALLAAEAAARSGTGLISVATRPEHVAAFVARRPELMVHGIRQPAEIEPLLAKATVVVAGPGLGTSAWARAMLERALQTNVPLVLDADALNMLTSGMIDALAARRDDPYQVLTPHPGEAARLLGIDSAAVQADRFAAAHALQLRFGGTVLLKGAGTIIDSGSDVGSAVTLPVAVATVGNPGMASGGMGDVLSGVIGGLIAQGWSLPMAARIGVVVHGVAADRAAAQDGERGLLAGDLLHHVHALMNVANR